MKPIGYMAKNTHESCWINGVYWAAVAKLLAAVRDRFWGNPLASISSAEVFIIILLIVRTYIKNLKSSLKRLPTEQINDLRSPPPLNI